MSEDINIEAIRQGDRVRVSLYGLPESDWLPVRQALCGQREVVFPDGTPWWCDHHEITAHEPAAPALPGWWGAKVILGPPEGHGVSIGGGYVFPNDSTHIYGPDDCEGWAVQVIVDRDGNQPAAQCAEEEDLGRCVLYTGHPGDHAAEGSISYDELRADLERVEAERDRNQRAAETLGKVVEDQCRDALNATGLHHLIDKDGDGDWGSVWENLASLGERARTAERMRDEWEGMYKITLATSLDLRSVGERRERDGADLEAFRAKVREVRDDLARVLPVHGNWVARGTLDHLSAILDGTDQ